MVVIAVIGLLASIVLVAMEGARERAREAKMSETLRQIDLAAHLDYHKHENWSPDVCPIRGAEGGLPCWHYVCGPNICGPNIPRFVCEGHFPQAAFQNIRWYCPECGFDWQLWGGDWVSIDVYKCRADGTCCDIVRRRCVGTHPHCRSF